MASSEPDDSILLQRTAAGDSDALLALHKRYANLVYSMAWRVLQDVGMAEEVTQDVFMKLWRREQRYDPNRGRSASPASPPSIVCARKAAVHRLSTCTTSLPITRRRWSHCWRPTTRAGSAGSI
jgi:DNA-directed RNA polymerase specialized sigma24 family protein